MHKSTVLLVGENRWLIRMMYVLITSDDEYTVSGDCTIRDVIIRSQEVTPDVVVYLSDISFIQSQEIFDHLDFLMPHVMQIVITPIDAALYEMGVYHTTIDGFVSQHKLDTDLLPKIRTLSVPIRNLIMTSDEHPELSADLQSLQRLVACSLDGIIMTNEQGQIIEWNPAMQQLTGIMAQSAVGMFITDVLNTLTPSHQRSDEQDDIQRRFVSDALASGIADGEGQLYERVIQRGDGRIKTVEISVFTIPTRGGYRLCNIVRDITGAKSAELQLKTLTAAVEQSPVTVIITDGDGHVEYANPRLTELTGYTLDEVRGQTPRIFKSGHTPPEIYEQMWATIKSGQLWKGQLLNRKKDGTLFWEDTHISPVIDHAGVIQHFVAVKEDITVRKHQERALKESEERFRTTFEQAAVGIAHISQDGHFLYINQKLCDMVGYTRDEMLSMRFQDITHPADLADDLALVEQMLSGQIETYKLDKRYICRDSSVQWVELSVSLTREDDRPKYFIAVVQDISIRKQAIEALKQSEYTLKRSQAIAQVGDWTWDIRTNTVRWSDEMYRIFGVDKASFTGELNEMIEKTIHPDDRAIVHAVNQAVIDKRNNDTLEYRVVWPDGSVRYIWAQSGDAVFDERGKLTSLSGVVQDITDRKQIEFALIKANRELDRLNKEVSQQNIRLEQSVYERTAQLRRLNDHMAIVLNNTSDAIVVLNADDCIENTNPSFDRLFGYSRDEAFRKHTRLIADTKYEMVLMEAIKNARHSDDSQRIQIDARRKDGQLFDADVALTHVKENADHVICSVRDITHLKELERAKDNFIAMVSHELRNPLSAITLSIDNMQRNYSKMSDEMRMQKLSNVQKQLDILTELVSAVLDTARFDNQRANNEYSLVNMRELLEKVISELRPQVEAKTQQINTIMDTGSITLHANGFELLRIWRNLIGNAIKYSGQGSIIRVHLYSGDEMNDQDWSEVPALAVFDGAIPPQVKQGHHMIGIVEDNGPGINEEDLPSLFTRFFRGWAAQTDIPGTGLGLSLVRDIVRSYGGDIVVHSAHHSGTAFCFWIPYQ